MGSRYGTLSIAFVLLLLGSRAVAQAPGPRVIVLTHAHVIDGTGAPPAENVTLVIRDGRIESISPQAGVPQGAAVLDLKGKYVLPGLIDAHVHIGNRAQARTALMSGVTTARSMGVSGYNDVGLRELAKAGRIESPEIVAAGYHVRPVPDETFFLDELSMADMMGGNGVRGPENVRRMVGALLERGVDYIKIIATERAGLPETDPRQQVYSEQEIAAAVEVAGRRGIGVAAHAHGDEGAQAAVRAGVRSIEHGTYLSDATIALMKEKGTYLVPTLAVVTDLMDVGGAYNSPLLQVRGRHMYPRLRETTIKAHRAGVKIVAATDGGYGGESALRLQHELEEMVKAGLSPMSAIQSATSVAAALLGVDKRTGAVKAGMDADLIVVERNPLENIVVLQDVLIVVNNGRIVVNRLER